MDMARAASGPRWAAALRAAGMVPLYAAAALVGVVSALLVLVVGALSAPPILAYVLARALWCRFRRGAAWPPYAGQRSEI